MADCRRYQGGKAGVEESPHRAADGRAEVSEACSATHRVRHVLRCHRGQRAGRVRDQQVKQPIMIVYRRGTFRHVTFSIE